MGEVREAVKNLKNDKNLTEYLRSFLKLEEWTSRTVRMCFTVKYGTDEENYPQNFKDAAVISVCTTKMKATKPTAQTTEA